MKAKKITTRSIVLVAAAIITVLLFAYAMRTLGSESFSVGGDDLLHDEIRPQGDGFFYRILTVEAQDAALYDAPGTENNVIAHPKQGQTFESEECRDAADGVTWYKVEYGGREAWIDRHLVSAENKYYIIHDRDFSSSEPIIYLSPSCQGTNNYCIGDTTEQEQMEAIGKEVRDILRAEYRCRVYLASPLLPITDRMRALDAHRKHADIYLAIHSNSDGDSDEMAGAMAFYFPTCNQSWRLAENIVSELGMIAPLPSTIRKQTRDGMKFTGNLGYGDVRDPSYLGMVSVLAETDFHDNPITAQWIMDNHTQIARAYVNALAKTFDMQRK